MTHLAGSCARLPGLDRRLAAAMGDISAKLGGVSEAVCERMQCLSPH